jgi:hypothetical protein
MFSCAGVLPAAHTRRYTHTGAHHPPAPGEDTCRSARAGWVLPAGWRTAPGPPPPAVARSKAGQCCCRQLRPTFETAGQQLVPQLAATTQGSGAQRRHMCCYNSPPPAATWQGAGSLLHRGQPATLRPPAPQSHTEKHTHILGISEVENGHPRGNRAALPLKQGSQAAQLTAITLRPAAVVACQASPSLAAA